MNSVREIYQQCISANEQKVKNAYSLFILELLRTENSTNHNELISILNYSPKLDSKRLLVEIINACRFSVINRKILWKRANMIFHQTLLSFYYRMKEAFDECEFYFVPSSEDLYKTTVFIWIKSATENGIFYLLVETLESTSIFQVSFPVELLDVSKNIPDFSSYKIKYFPYLELVVPCKDSPSKQYVYRMKTELFLPCILSKISFV